MGIIKVIKNKISLLGLAWVILVFSLTTFFWWAWGGGLLSPEFLKEKGGILLPLPSHASQKSLKNVSPSKEVLDPHHDLPTEQSPPLSEVHPLPSAEEQKGQESIKKEEKAIPASPVSLTKDKKPMVQYARSFEGGNKACISLIVMGLGPYRDLTRRAIQELPPEVTLAFAPYTRDVAKVMKEARSFGHEVLLMLPLEPEDRSQRDPGPYTLMVEDPWEKNQERLQNILSKGAEFVGVVGVMGGRFSHSPEAMKSALEALTQQGYLYVGGHLSLEDKTLEVSHEGKIPFAFVDRSLDTEISGISLESQLKDLEALCLIKNQCVGIGYLYPSTLEKLKSWIETLKEKKIVLAPITASLSADNSSRQKGNLDKEV